MDRALMLMVDRGNGKVRCAGRAHSVGTARRWHTNLGGSMYGGPLVAMALRYVARWWLVEAESADAARRLIDRTRTHTDSGVERGFVGPDVLPGRILASGVNGGAK